MAVIRTALVTTPEEETLSRLLRANFLGIEVAEGVFEYPKSEQEEKVARARSNRLSTQREGPVGFTIHPAFRPYLGIPD